MVTDVGLRHIVWSSKFLSKDRNPTAVVVFEDSEASICVDKDYSLNLAFPYAFCFPQTEAGVAAMSVGRVREKRYTPCARGSRR
ncbi:hypothetical protein AGR6A_pAt50111 [Agrobacterium sp. NCPPB 925]|nr:hypothetical protein AGR6A_pAt50111 [Agrobacterium sp. NCPPB 925]